MGLMRLSAAGETRVSISPSADRCHLPTPTDWLPIASTADLTGVPRGTDPATSSESPALAALHLATHFGPLSPTLSSDARSLVKAAAFGAVAVLRALAVGGVAAEATAAPPPSASIRASPRWSATSTTSWPRSTRASSRVHVVHEFTGSLIAEPLVRHKPQDLVLNNYDLGAGIFVTRDVLTDLAGVPQIKRIDPSVQELVGQYATPDEATDVIPYSITAAGVIYNKDLFEKNGVDVPTTWSELIAACKTFKAAGVTPIYATFKDTWTMQQGLFDYVSGSMIDVAASTRSSRPRAPTSARTRRCRSRRPSTGGGPDARARRRSPTSDPVPAYADGNAAFAKGGAMYMQGPWGIGEIAKAQGPEGGHVRAARDRQRAGRQVPGQPGPRVLDPDGNARAARGGDGFSPT